jgi:hypothetical protein
MATCPPGTLLADAACFVCLDAHQLEAAKAALLCQILKNLDPMASCNVSDLMANAGCLTCLPPAALQVVQTQLLCEILHANNQVSNSGVECGTVDPVADPGVECKIYYRSDTGAVWIWRESTAAWVKVVGP